MTSQVGLLILHKPRRLMGVCDNVRTASRVGVREVPSDVSQLRTFRTLSRVNVWPHSNTSGASGPLAPQPKACIEIGRPRRSAGTVLHAAAVSRDTACAGSATDFSSCRP